MKPKGRRQPKSSSKFSPVSPDMTLTATLTEGVSQYYMDSNGTYYCCAKKTTRNKKPKKERCDAR